MDTKALIPRAAIDDMAKAVFDFMPGAKDLPPAARMGLAYLGVAHDLNPILHECWAIPQLEPWDRNNPDKIRKVVGYDLFVGIKGLIKKGQQTGRYIGHRFTWLDKVELEAAGVVTGDVAVKALLEVATPPGTETSDGKRFWVYDGIGIVKAQEKTKMDHYKAARKRALADALKSAFPITGITGIVDEESNEVVTHNGHANTASPATNDITAVTSEWRLVGTDGPPITPTQAARDFATTPAPTTPAQDAADLYGEAAPEPAPKAAAPEPTPPPTGRPASVQCKTQAQLVALIEQHLPFFCDAAGLAVGPRVMQCLKDSGVPTWAHPDAWPSLCKRQQQADDAAQAMGEVQP